MKTINDLMDQYPDFFEDVEENGDIVYGYTEPGYTLREGNVILIGYWRDNEQEKYEFTDEDWDRLEELAEFEWSDEWSVCGECRRAVRTRGDSYGWMPSYWLGNGEAFCESCTRASESLTHDYLETLLGNPKKACTFAIDLHDHGYQRVLEGMKYGLHSGENQSPDVIAASLRGMDVTWFIFVLNSNGPFTKEFSVWVHEEDVGKIHGTIRKNLQYDIATEFGRALRGETSDWVTSVTYEIPIEDFIERGMP